jgi:hypothetical protein
MKNNARIGNYGFFCQFYKNNREISDPQGNAEFFCGFNITDRKIYFPFVSVLSKLG